MFFKSGHRKTSNPLLSLFRLLISLVIICVLGVGLLQAYKAFSGYDPMKLDLQSLKGLLTSDSAYRTLIGLLTFNPKGSVGLGDQVDMGSKREEKTKSNSPVKFRFAVLADSHKDLVSLAKALEQAREAGAKFVVVMGDLSDIGTPEELNGTKQVLDNSGLVYYALPGDHDLWDSRDKTGDAAKNFTEVFGKTYQSFSYDNVRYILIYNSDNYLGLDGVQLKWIEDELERAQVEESAEIFVFAPTPLFHPSSDHVMGKVTPKLKDQAEHLITTFKRFGVDLVFSADTHFYSSFTEPKNNLEMLTAGAITSEKNAQAPRFAIVDVLEDGSYNIGETEVK